MLSMYKDVLGKTVVEIVNCATMLEVKVFKMSNLGLTDFDTQLFGQLTNLEEMDISGNQLDTIPDFISLPQLRYLDCSHNRLSDLQFVQQFPCLERIDVEGNPVAFADFCIASFLCPTLKSINGQTINIQALNRKIENRAKPVILKVWNDHIRSLFSSDMCNTDFDMIADKFRLILKHAALRSTKPISKFQDFRVTLLVEEFLARVRNSTADNVKFGGSEESVKRNYTKRTPIVKEDDSARLPTEEGTRDEYFGNLPSDSGSVTVEIQVDGVPAETNVAVLRDGECVLLQDGMPVASVVEVIGTEAKTVESTTMETTVVDQEVSDQQVFSMNGGLEEYQTVVEVSTTASSVLENCVNGREDFQIAKWPRAGLSDGNAMGDVGCVQNGSVCVGRAKDVVPLVTSSSGNGRKVVRYWMYEGPQPKYLTSVGNKNSSVVVNRAVNGVRNGGRVLSSASAAQNGHQPRTCATPDRVKASTVPNMKSKGMIPHVPKFKAPVIDARQAAMIVCEINSSPMVVYRGRCKKGSGIISTAPRSTPRPASSDGPADTSSAVYEWHDNAERPTVSYRRRETSHSRVNSSSAAAALDAVSDGHFSTDIATASNELVEPACCTVLQNVSEESSNIDETVGAQDREANDGAIKDVMVDKRPKKRVRFCDDDATTDSTT